MEFQRSITIQKNKSFLLFGPRQTGKSTLVKELLNTPTDIYLDLLQEEQFLRFSIPGTFRKEIELHNKKYPAFTCVVDEVQNIPSILSEIHSLIESTKIRFIATGSSARKLKRTGANLTAGRAQSKQLFPLTYREIGSDFDLEKALTFGLLPTVWGADNLSKEDQARFLISYGNTYLKQEVLEEGLVRNIAPFSKFIELVAHEDSQLVNYTRIGSEVGLTSKTIREHYSILEDTFLGFFLPPFGKSKREQIVQHPKFFLFDPGVTNALAKVRFESLNPVVFGIRFEQFIVTQLKALLSYNDRQEDLYFWRTKDGAEIDIVCGNLRSPLFAIEVKSNPDDSGKALKHIDRFLSHYPRTPVFIVSPMKRGRLLRTPNGVEIEQLPWMEFFEEKLFTL